MNKSRGRIAAVFLVLAMVFAMMPMSVFAAEDSAIQTPTSLEGTFASDQQNSSASDNAVSVEGSSSVKENQYSYEYLRYGVRHLHLDGNTATVTYNADDTCLIVVSVASVNNEYISKMLGSGKAVVSAGENVTVDIDLSVDVDTIPNNDYFVEVFLLDPKEYYPLTWVYRIDGEYGISNYDSRTQVSASDYRPVSESDYPAVSGSDYAPAAPMSGDSGTVSVKTALASRISPSYAENYDDYSYVGFENLTIDTHYIVAAFKNSAAADLFAPDNLLYIAQLYSSMDGFIGMVYEPRESVSNAKVLAFARTQKSIANAVVTVASAMYNGQNQSPKITVILDGKELKQNVDYALENSDFAPIFAGDYDVYVIGMGDYKDDAIGTFTINSPELTLSPNVVTVQKGKTAVINASFNPADTGDEVVAWNSSNQNIAVVDNNGKITGVSKGKATITAYAASGNTVNLSVTVVDNAKATTSITLRQTALSLTITRSKPNPTASVSATIKGGSTGKTWYSDNTNVATVTSSGKVTAVSAGEANIYCRTADGTTSQPCVVTVNKFLIDSESNNIIDNVAYVNVNKQIKLNLDSNIYKSVTWKSSNTKIASIVSSDGKSVTLKGLKKGTVTVTATADKKNKETIKLTVVNPTTSLSFNKTNKDSVYVGKSITLKTVVSKNSNDPISWSSDNPQIASVTAKGVVKGLKQGTTRITASTASGKSISATVTVRSKATALYMYNSISAMYPNSSSSLSVAITAPSYNCNDTITWTTSNKNVVSIASYSSDGKSIGVKSGKAGTATITAKSGSGKRVTAKITVMEPSYEVQDIKMNITSADIYVGQSVTAKIASVTPKKAKVAVERWYSDDDDIATVDAAGKITGVNPGTTVISCYTLGGRFKKEIEVTVRRKATAVSFDATAKTISVGQTLELNAYTSPQYTNEKFTWKSSNAKVVEIVSTNEDTAWVKGLKKGTANITVKTGSGKSKSIKITVSEQKGVINLTLWGSENDQSFLKEVSASWAKKYASEHSNVPTVNVSVQIKGEDVAGEAALKNTAAAADVYGVANDQIAGLAQANAIYKLPAAAAQSVAELDGASMFASTIYKGSSYGFPYAPNTAEVLFYNKSLYTEEEVKNLNTMLAKDLGTTTNLAADIDSSWNSMTWFATAGAALYEGGDKSINTMNVSEVTEMLKWLKGQIDDGSIVDVDSLDDAAYLLRKGKVAALFYGAWGSDELRAALGKNFGVVELPSVTVENSVSNQHLKCFGGSKLLVVNAKSANTDAAVSLAQYITNRDNQLKRYNMTQQTPVSPLLADDISDSVTAAEVAQSAYTITNDPLVGTADYWSLEGEVMTNLYSGKLTSDKIQAALNTMVKKMQANVGA